VPPAATGTDVARRVEHLPGAWDDGRVVDCRGTRDGRVNGAR
jgi:hypothetical protein